MLGEIAANRDVREDLRHQLAARPLHHRVGRGDDERVRSSDVGFERALDALGDMALVDVAPEVPLAEVRVVPEAGEALVVGALHDVREAEPDERDAAPAVELPCHLLAEHLRQRVGGLGAQLVLLVDRRIVGRPVERETERRLARSPDHALQACAHGGCEDRVRAHDVGSEDGIRRGVHGRRDRRQVNHRVGSRHLRGTAVEDLEGLSEVGEVGGEERRGRVGAARFRRRHDVDVQHLVAALEQVPDDRPPRLAATAGDDDLHRRRTYQPVLRRAAAIPAIERRSGGTASSSPAR